MISATKGPACWRPVKRRERLDFQSTDDWENVHQGNQKEGLSTIHCRGNNKNNCYRNSRIAPLRRYLRRQLGRPWNDVWKEVCEQTDPRTFSGQDLREDIDRLVTRKCILNHLDQPCDPNGRVLQGSCYWPAFYVHPQSGLLKVVEPTPRVDRTARLPTVFEVQGRFLHQHQDVWYRIELQRVPDSNQVTDVFLGSLGGWRDDYYNCERARQKYVFHRLSNLYYCTAKQPANGKEIRLARKLAAEAKPLTWKKGRKKRRRK